MIELLIESDTDEPILHLLERNNFNEEQIDAVLKQTFSSGVTKLSREFMQECSRIMEETGLQYHEAVLKLGLHHSDFRNKDELLDLLPYYGEVLKGSTIGGKPAAETDNPEVLHGKIGNPTVHIALNQLRRVVNCLLQRFGNPTEISLELSRELKMSKEDKQRIFNEQKKNKKENDRIYNELKSLGISYPASWDIKKYKLWEELAIEGIGRRCIYCGKTISASQVFSGDIEIEHILPYSRTLMNGMNNLTIAHKRCNAFKGNRTPGEAFSSFHKDFNYQAIVERASHLPRGKSRLFLKDAMKEWEKKAGFMDRQLTDNAYLSKKSKEYLSVICKYDNIWTIKGSQTALLRARWGYNKILSNSKNSWHKNRSDHRHHAIDALIIGLTDRKTIQSLASNSIRQVPDDITVPASTFLVRDVTEKVKNIIVSHKQDHSVQGRLFNDTALGVKFQQKRCGFDSFKTIEDVNRLVSRKLQKEFKDLIHQEGMNKAKKLITSRWHADNDAEGPYCLVPQYVTRKNLKDLKATEIKRVWDEDLKMKILKSINIDDLNAKQLQMELEKYGKENGIRRVRIIADNTENAVKIKSVSENKAYLPNDYLYVDIWAIPPHKTKKQTEYKGHFVNRVQANNPSFQYQKYHPAAKKVMTLFKNDIIQLIDSANRIHWGLVKGYSTTQNKLDLYSIYSSSNLLEWNEKTNPEILDDLWKPQKGQNFISINKIFQNYQVRKIFITADGRERI